MRRRERLEKELRLRRAEIMRDRKEGTRTTDREKDGGGGKDRG